MGKLKQKYPEQRDFTTKIIILAGGCRGEQIDWATYYHPNAIVYVIEPMPKNMEAIRALYENKEYPNLVFIQKACWDSNGTMYMIDYGEPHKHSFYDRPTSERLRKGKVQVETMDFAEFIESLEHVNFIRMNIEGSEYRVLFHCFDKGVMNRIGHLDVQLHGGRIPSLEKYKDKKGNDLLKQKLLEWHPKESHRWRLV